MMRKTKSNYSYPNLFLNCPLSPGFPNTLWKPNLFLPSYVRKGSYAVGSVQKSHRFSPQNVFKKNQYNVHYPQFTVTLHHAKHFLSEVTNSICDGTLTQFNFRQVPSNSLSLILIWTSAMQKATSQSDDY